MLSKILLLILVIDPLVLCFLFTWNPAPVEWEAKPSSVVLKGDFVATHSAAVSFRMKQDVIEKLKFYDSIYQGDITAGGIVVRHVDNGSPNGIEQAMTLRFSRNNSRIALVEKMTKLPEFKYIPLPEGVDHTRAGVVSYDADRNMYSHIETAAGITFENDRSAKTSERTSFKISPEEEVLHRYPPQYIQSVYGPDDVSLILPVVSIQRVLGRGFSECITEIVDVKEKSSSQLKVVASGGAFVNGSNKGTWHLTIDTSSQYLVRSATFYLDNYSSPFITVTNDEIEKIGPVSYPKRGKFNLHSSSDVIESTKYSIEFVRLETDESVFADCKELNDEHGDSRTIQVDNRMEPAAINLTGNISVNEGIEPASGFGLLWTLVSIALILAGLSVFVISFLKMRK